MALHVVFAAVASLAVLARGAAPSGACPSAGAAENATEDLEEAGFVQAARHLHWQAGCTEPLGLGETCVLPTSDCTNKHPQQSCPCDEGLTCVPQGPPSRACAGTCYLKDGQLCERDGDCAGGACGGLFSKSIKSGLCRTNLSSVTINLIDVSGGGLDANPELKKAFEKAASRYESIITGQVVIPEPLVVDIEISVEPIDGPSNILAFAGPTYVVGMDILPYGVRWLPTSGIMVFDIEDILSPTFAPLAEPIILHEMAHVLGLGILWELSYLGGVFSTAYDMTNCHKTAGVDTRYNSLDGFATSAYLHRKGYVPTGLPSLYTRGRVPPIDSASCGHWDEATLDNELMTPFVDLGGMPLSDVTIGLFEDLGYVVDYSAADRYRVPVNGAVLAASRQGKKLNATFDEKQPELAGIVLQPGGRVPRDQARAYTDEQVTKLRAKYSTSASR